MKKRKTGWWVPIKEQEGSQQGLTVQRGDTSEELATFLLQSLPRVWDLEVPIAYAVTLVGLHISRRNRSLWCSAQQQISLREL